MTAGRGGGYFLRAPPRGRAADWALEPDRELELDERELTPREGLLLGDRLDAPLERGALCGRLETPLGREVLRDGLETVERGALCGRLETPLGRVVLRDGLETVERGALCGRLETPLGREVLRDGLETALDRGRARVSAPDRSRDSNSMPRGLREGVDPLDFDVEAAGRDPAVPVRGRARAALLLAEVAAATLPGAFRERTRAAEPVSPLVAARPRG